MNGLMNGLVTVVQPKLLIPGIFLVKKNNFWTPKTVRLFLASSKNGFIDFGSEGIVFDNVMR
jgi:hypothetical protein